MSAPTVQDEPLPVLPCHVGNPDLWFADSPADLERAKALCADCPIRRQCLAAALDRGEPLGCVGRRDTRPRLDREL
jgi:WhiB family transcriptional regulator, redox-sensing transcriptional regulator